MASSGTGAARDPETRLIPMPTVGQIMRPATSTVESDAHLAAAAYLMKHHQDSALVVATDDQIPIAVVSDADISHAVADRRALEDTRISDLHLPRPVTVEATTSAEDAARLMLSRGFRHLPVVDHGRLAGMVELSDLCLPLLGRPQLPSTRNGPVPAESPGPRTPASWTPERWAFPAREREGIE